MHPSRSDPEGRDCLVFGGSGAVGRFLLRRLAAREQPATVLSRNPVPQWARDWRSLHWQAGALDTFPPRQGDRAIDLLSAGPLDALAHWLPRSRPAPGSSIIALSSMSVEWKRDSPNPGERRLAARLAAAESTLRAHAGASGLRLVLLRPTLIYGAGVDRSLTPLLRRATRWHLLPWPMQARGLRQPVHADDVAAAMLAALSSAAGSTLALPGADTLRFDVVVDRLLRVVAAHRVAVPLPLPRAALKAISRREGRLGAAAAVLWRSADDQLADAAWTALGVRPRGFTPLAADFVAW